MRSITLICGRTFTVVKFREKLIESLINNNYKVSVIALDNDYEDRIVEWGAKFYCINHNNRSVSIRNKISLYRNILDLLVEIKPDIVFTFMLTPNIFGTLAAHKCGIKRIYSMVEGAGDVFFYQSPKWILTRFITCFLLRKSFRYVNKVFFLNDDDKKEFIHRRIVSKNKCIRIDGIGVDTNHYKFTNINNTNNFLMIARMMPSKGIKEYCEAARIVKKRYPNANFYYAGEEFTLKKKDIQEYIDDSSITYLGYQDDIRSLYQNCFCMVSTSYYREGLPMVLMEAGSSGRPSIVLNNYGCKEIIRNKYNGLIVDSKKPKDIAKAMIYALENKDEMIQMGANARKLIEEKYNQRTINDQILNVLKNQLSVLHILGSNSYNGAENVVCQIINMFSKNNEIEMAYCSKKGSIEKVLIERKINYYMVNNIFNIFKLKKIVKDYNPDIIHAHDFKCSFLAMFLRRPYISHMHNNNPWMKRNGIVSAAYYFAAKKSEYILCVSKSIINEYVHSSKLRNKMIVVGNPINVGAILKSASGYCAPEYDVGFCGRLVEQKNPIEFINIVKELKKNNYNIKAIMLGKGKLENKIRKMISKYSLDNNITIAGFVSNPYEILNKTKVLCMPSLYEGFGLAAIESLILSTPVVCSGAGGLIDIVDDNCGKICKNTEDYVKELNLLLSNDIYYLKKEINAGEKGISFDNIKKYKITLECMYEEIANG